MKTSLQTHRRKAISPIIATILVVAMTIVAAGVLYTYFTTTASRAQNTNQIQVSAALAVPSGTGSGTGTITVTDSGSTALTGLTVSSTVPGFALGTSAFYTGSTPAALSPANPLPPGSSVSAIFTGTSVTAGTSYSITVLATFANGATQTQVVIVTAQ
jgi:flagellin-like protein